MDELQTQIDETNTRIDDIDASITELSDNTTSSSQDLETSIDETKESLDEVNDKVGQLEYPLSQDTIDLIKEIYPTGFITLAGGTATLKDGRISTISNILLTVSIPGGTQGFLSYVASNGQAVITSTSGTETSIISYMILN